MAQVHTVTVRTSVAVAQQPAEEIQVKEEILKRLLRAVQYNRTAEVGQRVNLIVTEYKGERGTTYERPICPLWLFEWANRYGEKVLRVKAWDYNAEHWVKGVKQEGGLREFRLDRIVGLRNTTLPDTAPFEIGMQHVNNYATMTIFPVDPSNAYLKPMYSRLEDAQDLIATGYWDWRPAANPIPYVTIIRGANG